MSLKHLIAIADGSAGDNQALEVASALANWHDGVVEVLPSYADCGADMLSLGMALGAVLSPEVIESFASADKAVLARIEDAARTYAGRAEVAYGAGEGAPRLWVTGRGVNTAAALGQRAPLADLVIFGRRHLSDGAARELFGQALLEDRAPLLVARLDAESLGGPAAVAWDGSSQAGRAVKAALPLLATAARIYILQHPHGIDPGKAGSNVTALNRYLGLHGAGTGELIIVEGDSEGRALLDAAETLGATLLVAGAWGHPRMREAIFGGATRTFLAKRDEGPNLLLAH